MPTTQKKEKVCGNKNPNVPDMECDIPDGFHHESERCPLCGEMHGGKCAHHVNPGTPGQEAYTWPNGGQR